jgi:LysR family transcriptional regulator, nitrogen assimilation regulatory protein
LEDEIGTQLYYRHGRGIRYTEAGKTFRSTISLLIKKLIRQAMGPRVVQAFHAQFPHVKLHMSEGFSGYVNEWLVAGRVEVSRNGKP